MMAELLLSSDELEIECPIIYGISSFARSYRLAWFITQFRTHFIQKEEDVFHYSEKSQHTCYILRGMEDESALFLIRNKGSKAYFYKKYKDFDYLLFSIASGIKPDPAFIAEIKKLDCVRICLALETPKKPENLNFIQLI